ncbi:unnamed protein product [Discosporangium mesarthrocarpum]
MVREEEETHERFKSLEQLERLIQSKRDQELKAHLLALQKRSRHQEKACENEQRPWVIKKNTKGLCLAGKGQEECYLMWREELQ